MWFLFFFLFAMVTLALFKVSLMQQGIKQVAKYAENF